jgi:hypothetical protein
MIWYPKRLPNNFERFLSSEGFKEMPTVTTKSIISAVVCDTVQPIVENITEDKMGENY